MSIIKHQVLVAIWLFCSLLWQPLMGQKNTFQNRSYAYGAKIAQAFQNKKLPPAAMEVDQVLLGMKAALAKDLKMIRQAKQTLQGTDVTAQERAYAEGVLTLGCFWSLPVTEADFDWKALRLGYTDVLQNKPLKWSNQQVEWLYLAHQDVWKQRHQTTLLKQLLPAGEEDRQILSYAIGAKEAETLKEALGGDTKDMEADDFVAGIQAIGRSAPEDWFFSDFIRGELTTCNEALLNPPYHMGHSLLGTGPIVRQYLATALEMAELEQGFRDVIRQEKPKFEATAQATILSTFTQHVKEVEVALMGQANRNRHDLMLEIPQHYAPDTATAVLTDPLQRRSYALGAFAVQSMNKFRYGMAALDYEAFEHGLQLLLVLDGRWCEITVKVLNFYVGKQQMPKEQSMIAHDHGQFFIFHLLSYTGAGVVMELEDFDFTWLRRGFEDAAQSKPLLLSKRDQEGEVRRYRVFLMERMEHSQPCTPAFQQAIKDRSYAYGYQTAKLYRGAKGHYPYDVEIDLEALARGLEASIYGDAAQLKKEAYHQLFASGHITANAQQRSYHLGVSIVGVKHHIVETLLLQPLPQQSFDVDAFKAGYKDCLDEESKDCRQNLSLSTVTFAYKHYLKNRYLETLARRQEAFLKKHPNFAEENARRPEVYTNKSGTGLQYEILNKGIKGAHPEGEDILKLHSKYQLLDGTIVTDTKILDVPSERSLKDYPARLREALALMTSGSKYRFYLPYGVDLEPLISLPVPIGSYVVYEIEMIDITIP